MYNITNSKVVDTILIATALAIVYVIVVGVSVFFAGPANDPNTLIVCGIGFVVFLTLYFGSESSYPENQKNSHIVFEFLETSIIAGLALSLVIFLIPAIYHMFVYTWQTATIPGVVLVTGVALCFGYLTTTDINIYSDGRRLETLSSAAGFITGLALVNGVMRTIATADATTTGRSLLISMILGYLLGAYLTIKYPEI